MNNIRKRKTDLTYPEPFLDKDRKITQITEVVDGFNSFFVDVGPTLAKEISNTGKRFSVEYCGDKIIDSMSLGTVNKKEIIVLLNKCMKKLPLMGMILICVWLRT